MTPEQQKAIFNEILHLKQLKKSDDEIRIILSRYNYPIMFINQMINYTDNYIKSYYGNNQSQPNNNYSNVNNNYNNIPTNQNSNLKNTNNSNISNNTIKVEHTHKLSPMTLTVIICVFILILSGVSASIFLFSTPTTDVLLDYEIELPKTFYKTDENIEFYARTSSMGSKKSHDGFITYKLFNENDDEVLKWSDTRALINVQRFMVTHKIPDDIESGKYYISSEIKYGENQRADATSSTFNIIKINNNPNPISQDQQSQQDNNNDNNNVANNNENNVNNIATTDNQSNNVINSSQNTTIKNTNNTDDEGERFRNWNNQQNNNNINNNDTNNNGNNVNTSVISKTSDNLYGTEQIPAEVADEAISMQEEQNKIVSTIETAVTFAITEPQKAGEMCLSLKSQNYIDNCFLTLSYKSMNYKFCESIQRLDSKDLCYMRYVIKQKDYDKCSMIVNPKSKTSCSLLNPNYQG